MVNSYHDALISAHSRYFNNIYDWAGKWVRELVTRQHPSTSDTTILDVGAGQGKYRVILPEYELMYGCEIWEPTVIAENLNLLYRFVFIQSIVDLVNEPSWHEMNYDVIIMGDVLEHLAVDDAKMVLERCYEHCDDVIVVVPYLYEQGPQYGNEYQRHLQEDLTPELMMARYPDLQLISTDHYPDGRLLKGLYRRCV